MNANTISSARCWFKPCEDNSNLLLDVEQKQECVSNICQTIIEAHAQGNININDNTSSLSCSFTKNQLADANAKREELLNPKQPKPPATTPENPYFNLFLDFVKNNKTIIAAVAVGIVLLVVIIKILKR